MSPGPVVDLHELESSLGSPLRLRLVAELLDKPGGVLSIEEAVRRSGRHVQDVTACLKPLVAWGVLEELEGGTVVRLRPGLDDACVLVLQRTVANATDLLQRERHVRHSLLAGMIGVDPKMQLVFEMARQASRIDVPVMITGETGTGKELVARAVHDLSGRRNGVFGAVNCPTLTESLFESEVFGHVRGAFTGAVRDHTGLIERCHRGTLFLDEIGDLSLANQVKLLRVLQDKMFTRVGDGQERFSDFRLITATNRDLAQMVRTGEFREELYYRINVFPIRLPSLRERMSDLPYLIEEILLNQVGQLAPELGQGQRTVSTELSPEALERLRQYHWPGNIRELENVILRAAIMADGKPIREQHLPVLPGPGETRQSDSWPGVTEAGQPSQRAVGPGAAVTGVMGPGSGGVAEVQAPLLTAETRIAAMRSLAEVEKEHIEAVLGATRGNIRSASEILGISRTTLYKKISDYQLDNLLMLRSQRQS